MLQINSRYKPRPLKHGDADSCTCPHCWMVYPVEDALYVARHPDLVGDPLLGPEAASRFKPTRFTAEGQAIDPGGYPCLEMACPNCHLEVPKCCSDYRSMFLSVIGTPSSGKSFFLTSMIWQLRRLLASQFAMAFTDIETVHNSILHEYEETLFFPKDPQQFVSLRKTEQQGETYNRVLMENTEVLLPKPFLFTLMPQARHPESRRAAQLSRSVVLYDNAGEHFNPTQDTFREPGTMHMARSECLYFLFDPTQDSRFRALLRGHPDPQCQTDFRVQRQDVVFNEAIRRVRRHLAIREGERHKKLVIVIVNKYDIWKNLLPFEPKELPLIQDRTQLIAGLDVAHVEDVSLSVRALLERVCPEVVASLEQFADRIAYMPCSPLGHSPTRNPETRALEVQPQNIKPFWAEVPFLYAFARAGLIYRGTSTPQGPVEDAKLLMRKNGTIFCKAGEHAFEVPEIMAGRVVHHPVDGTLVRIPVPQHT